MAAFDTSRTTYAADRSGFGAYLATLKASVVSWNERRLTRKMLNALTDRELDDIGLSRGDISRL